jgi:hypothetical protein
VCFDPQQALFTGEGKAGPAKHPNSEMLVLVEPERLLRTTESSDPAAVHRLASGDVWYGLHRFETGMDDAVHRCFGAGEDAAHRASRLVQRWFLHAPSSIIRYFMVAAEAGALP